MHDLQFDLNLLEFHENNIFKPFPIESYVETIYYGDGHLGFQIVTHTNTH